MEDAEAKTAFVCLWLKGTLSQSCLLKELHCSIISRKNFLEHNVPINWGTFSTSICRNLFCAGKIEINKNLQFSKERKTTYKYILFNHTLKCRCLEWEATKCCARWCLCLYLLLQCLHWNLGGTRHSYCKCLCRELIVLYDFKQIWHWNFGSAFSFCTGGVQFWE